MKQSISSRITRFRGCWHTLPVPSGVIRAVRLMIILAVALSADAALGGLAVSPLGAGEGAPLGRASR